MISLYSLTSKEMLLSLLMLSRVCVCVGLCAPSSLILFWRASAWLTLLESCLEKSKELAEVTLAYYNPLQQSSISSELRSVWGWSERSATLLMFGHLLKLSGDRRLESRWRHGRVKPRHLKVHCFECVTSPCDAALAAVWKKKIHVSQRKHVLALYICVCLCVGAIIHSISWLWLLDHSSLHC